MYIYIYIYTHTYTYNTDTYLSYIRIAPPHTGARTRWRPVTVMLKLCDLH